MLDRILRHFSAFHRYQQLQSSHLSMSEEHQRAPRSAARVALALPASPLTYLARSSENFIQGTDRETSEPKTDLIPRHVYSRLMSSRIRMKDSRTL